MPILLVVYLHTNYCHIALALTHEIIYLAAMNLSGLVVSELTVYPWMLQKSDTAPFFWHNEFGGARVCSDLSQAIARKPGTFGTNFDT